MYGMEVFLCMELAFLFFVKWWQEKTERHISILGLSYLFLGIARIFLILWDYVALQAVPLFYNIAAFFVFLAMAIMLHAAETLMGLRRRLLSICFVVISPLMIVLPIEVVRILYYTLGPVVVLATLFFTGLLVARTFGAVRKKFLLLFLGMILYTAGYGLGAEFIKNAMPPFFQIMQEAIVLAGFSVTAFGFMNIPILAEIHWERYLLHVYVFHSNSSVCIYSEPLAALEPPAGKASKQSDEQLRENDDGPDAEQSRQNVTETTENDLLGYDENSDIPMDADLFGSGMAGIRGMVHEMLRSEKRLKELDHEDKKVLLEYGDHIIVALVTSRLLDGYHVKLEQYVQLIEKLGANLLVNWTGEISKLRPIIEACTKIVFKNIVDVDWWRTNPAAAINAKLRRAAVQAPDSK